MNRGQASTQLIVLYAPEGKTQGTFPQGNQIKDSPFVFTWPIKETDLLGCGGVPGAFLPVQQFASLLPPPRSHSEPPLPLTNLSSRENAYPFS